jgi:hypothetical protein
MKVIQLINEPVPFAGTQEEADANYATHAWWDDPQDWERYCDNCGSKGWHKAAFYPCGQEPPRRDVVVWVDAQGETHATHPTLAALGIPQE